MRPARTLACVAACIALAATAAPAQTSRTIRGTVESVEPGEPLAGALLRSLVPGSPTIATSSETGAFSLDGPADRFRLLVARIGFVPDTVLVPSGQETISIRLRPTVVELDTLTVTGRADDLIGIASSASQGRVGAGDLRSRPIAREGELLETVPGVIVTQHSGDGKANQYFIRGFNLDHGTDFATRFEGMPVNMVSHAHGQGYTDLNFLIPELVDHLDYKLGVYHAERGGRPSASGRAASGSGHAGVGASTWLPVEGSLDVVPPRRTRRRPRLAFCASGRYGRARLRFGPTRSGHYSAHHSCAGLLRTGGVWRAPRLPPRPESVSSPPLARRLPNRSLTCQTQRPHPSKSPQ